MLEVQTVLWVDCVAFLVINDDESDQVTLPPTGEASGRKHDERRLSMRDGPSKAVLFSI